MAEWHILNDALQRTSLIEGYDSFIWTERYAAWGEFQIVIAANSYSRNLLRPGLRIGMTGSQRVMRIETVTDEINTDGKKTLTVTGRSVEHFLDDRVAMPAMAGTVTTPKWSITGTPGYIARYLFTQICVTGVLSANDTIAGYHSGTLNPPGSLVEPSTTYTIEFDPDTLYNSIKKVCDIWLLGFRLVKDGDTGNIYFEVYTGNDCTTSQTTRKPVIFGLEMESIDKTSIVRSISDVKSVAYVFAPNGTAVVYANGYDSTVAMTDRRVLLVKADDIEDAAGSTLTAKLNQRGLEELAKYRDVYAFDGEVPVNQPYVYGRDYGLGDLVEEHGPEGFSNYMVVTEQIFVSDAEGDRAYPTLLLYNVIVPGSWTARGPAQQWADVPPTQHWGDL